MAEEFNVQRKHLDKKWQLLFDSLVMGGVEEELNSTE